MRDSSRGNPEEVPKTEILKARSQRYQAWSDLVTEMALRWTMALHPHSLDEVDDGCRWCATERRILASGHMASKRPSPRWWERFLAEYERGKKQTPHSWTDLKITRSDGRWWVVRVTESLDLHEPATGEATYQVAPWGGGTKCSAMDFSRLNVRRLKKDEGGTPKKLV